MLRKVKRLPVMVRLVLIIVFLGSLSGCGDSADPLGTGILQFYDVVTNTVITSVTVDPGGSLTLVVRVMNLRSDGTLAPVIGERVAFTLLTPANSGGLTVVNDRTAGNGQAMALYTAGNNFAIDSVRATTGAGATATITINKTGGIVGARISSLAASSTSVADGETSIITATVTDGNANPMMGEPVTFTIPTNDSNACFINAANACVPSVIVSTDGSGRAMAVYHGGSRSPNVDVYDTVRATLANGSTNFVVITRSSTTPLALTVTASPATLNAGQVSIVTARLTGANNSGVAVSFTLAVNNSGATLSASTAITDGAGNAVVIYSAGANNPTQTVSDSVRASAGAMTGAVAITRTGSGLTTVYSIDISSLPATVGLSGGSTVITANVKNNLGTAVSGVTVNFTQTGGVSILPASSITDGSGNAVSTFTGAGGTAGTTAGIVTASITIDGTTYTDAVVITRE